jgi:hypothetical protein
LWFVVHGGVARIARKMFGDKGVAAHGRKGGGFVPSKIYSRRKKKRGVWRALEGFLALARWVRWLRSVREEPEDTAMKSLRVLREWSGASEDGSMGKWRDGGRGIGAGKETG